MVFKRANSSPPELREWEVRIQPEQCCYDLTDKFCPAMKGCSPCTRKAWLRPHECYDGEVDGGCTASRRDCLKGRAPEVPELWCCNDILRQESA